RLLPLFRPGRPDLHSGDGGADRRQTPGQHPPPVERHGSSDRGQALTTLRPWRPARVAPPFVPPWLPAIGTSAGVATGPGKQEPATVLGPTGWARLGLPPGPKSPLRLQRWR